jgi:hypothetical protein
MGDLFVPIVSAVVAAVLGFLTIRLSLRKNKPKTEAPANPVAPVARDVVQETFEEAVDRIENAKTAEELAALGNARKRR